MATKAVLEKENKELLKERDSYKRKYDSLKKRKDKVRNNVIDDSIIKIKDEIIAEKEAIIGRLKEKSIDKSSHVNDFIALPWYRRMFFNRDELRTMYRDGLQ